MIKFRPPRDVAGINVGISYARRGSVQFWYIPVLKFVHC